MGKLWIRIGYTDTCHLRAIGDELSSLRNRGRVAGGELSGGSSRRRVVGGRVVSAPVDVMPNLEL